MSNTPTLYYLVGLPASGKTTYAHQLAKENENTIVLSSDAIRGELYGDESIQGDSNEVFNLLHKRVKENLKNGVNVVYDACNVKSKERRSFVQSLKNIDCWKRCIVMATPYKECIERSKKRERVVPEHVIERMYKKWDMPHQYEGWDTVSVFYGDNKKDKDMYKDFIIPNREYKQDNPHHKLTLGEHCEVTKKRLSKVTDSKPLLYAALLHDCGKCFTKSFKNSKGEVTNVAHYYGHEHVGAYESMFYSCCSNNNILTPTLIGLHMYPYIWERDNNEKMRNKYKRIWGYKLYNDVMKLHEADKFSH